MNLQFFTALIKEQINGMSRTELEDYIMKLKRGNDSKSKFLHSPVLTSNTLPFYNSIRFNDLIIRLCEDKLESFGLKKNKIK